MSRKTMERRGLLGMAASAVTLLALPLRALASSGDDGGGRFRPESWQDHFDSLQNGAILADTRARVLHFWSEDGGTYRLYPCAARAGTGLGRGGRTQVVRKIVGPTWRPTPDALARDPGLPHSVAPGLDNPLGSHALYLGWRSFRIHGSPVAGHAGAALAEGSIGLTNAHIAELFPLVRIGAQVRLI